ncbi:hypothetical protein ABT124_43775 [Streptomyces sp. NPDC001982]|uniref:hypothetical protein n=1 Tax=Streptomyces sp. NPDC001982 TaxID=3154405 RepID=UPI003321BE1C
MTPKSQLSVGDRIVGTHRQQPPGSSFEDEVCRRVARRYRYSARQVHVRRYAPAAGAPGTPGRGLVIADPRAKVDCVGSDRRDGGLRLFEAKESGPPDFANPGLTANQRIVYPRLVDHGGEVAADRGPFAAGTRVPRGTRVVVVTPATIDFVLPEP